MPRGRPSGSRNTARQVPGFHIDADEAIERGLTIASLRRQERTGVGPLPIRVGQHVFYKDGSYAAYLEALYRRRNEPQVVRRGRPSAHASA